MKITEPLFAIAATGPLFGVGFFSGPPGRSRFTSYPLAPRNRTRGNEFSHAALRATLKRWHTRPYASAILWRDFTALQMKLTPPISQVFTSTRQGTAAGYSSATLPQHIIEPN